MARWIQYLDLDLGNELNPICGTFNIIRVDNRLNLKSQLEIAHNNLKGKRKGFLLLGGERLLNTKIIKYYKLPKFEKYKLGEYCFT